MTAPGTGDDDARAAAADLVELLRATVAELRARRAPDEALAEVRAKRSFGPIKRQPAMVPVGRAWRLGVLLLSADGSLRRTGSITRAVEPTRSQGLDSGVEARKEARRQAVRAFEEGDAVDYDWKPIALDAASLARGSGPLSLRGREIRVQWGPAAHETRSLDAYLADRIEVLGIG
ncbi:hypothetical protein [Clavibacter michiganensis]|uniref:hypothetical protein n=1 Tax=Clavibacter michiganensis TaxID=28447 RepID=UPI00292FD4D4|nr:hypothetical protein [Clavibacter michiganensis]